MTDTPGLLNRVDEDRNSMERLTLASVAHLPTCVMYVTDLTGLCGTSAADQLAIREDLKQQFPGARPPAAARERRAGSRLANRTVVTREPLDRNDHTCGALAVHKPTRDNDERLSINMMMMSRV